MSIKDIGTENIETTNKFVPHFEAPWTRPGNWQCYTMTDNGGISPCIEGNTDSPGWAISIAPLAGRYNVLPNCVGYAFGRALEAWGPEWVSPLLNAGFAGPASANIYYSTVQSWTIPKPVPGCLVLFKYKQHIEFCESSDGVNFRTTAADWDRSLSESYSAFYTSYHTNEGQYVFVLPSDVSFAAPYEYLVERRHILYGDHNATYDQEWIWKDTD